MEEDLVEVKIVPAQADDHKDNTSFAPYDTLVLAGGGIKGLFTTGALQYLYENGTLSQAKTYIGTSIGSIIAYMLIIGYTPIEMISYICSKKFLDNVPLVDFASALSGGGAVPFSGYQEMLETMTIDKIGILLTMKDIREKCGKRLICTAFNITENRVEYISDENHPEMPCLTALRLSCSLPIIFSDFKYKNSYYIDGGIGDNFPFNYGKKIGQKVLGIDLNQKKNLKRLSESNFLVYFYNILSVMTLRDNGDIKETDLLPHKVINIDTKEFASVDLGISTPQKLDMFSSGYQQCKEQFNIF
jgi:predicted acylesterase/phospholipase RssA